MLESICEILALQRSLLEAEVAKLQMTLESLDNQLQTMEERVIDITTEEASGTLSNDPISRAIMFVQWRDMMVGNIRAVRKQRNSVFAQLGNERQRLKEVLVKEDIITNELNLIQRANQQRRLEYESATRLEGWVASQSSAS